MHAQPPRMLKRLLKQYGQELLDDPRRTEALLRDLCGQHTREIFVLVNAQKQRVPGELLAAPTWMPRQATYSRLSRQLQNKLALTEDAADWAVASWAEALGLEDGRPGSPLAWFQSPPREPAAPARRKNRHTRTFDGHKGSADAAAKGRTVRARAADMGWRWPAWLPTSAGGRWLEVLPWIALGSATVVLLAVVYWMARTPLTPARAEPAAGNAAVPAGQAAAPNADAVYISTGETPGQLTAPEYLARVLSLPTAARISADSVNIRLGASTADQVVGTLDMNEGVHVVGFSADGAWAEIDQPRSAWVSNDYLLFESQDGAQATIVVQVRAALTANRVTDVYPAPRQDAPIRYQLAPSLEVVVAAVGVGDAEGWVELAAPVQGWMAAADLFIETP